MKTAIIGASAMIEPAHNEVQSVEFWLIKEYRPTVTVLSSGTPSVKIKGMKKLFQAPIKVNRPTVASIGAARGSMTHQYS